MVHKNVRMLILGLVLAVLATGMLFMTIRESDGENDTSSGRELLRPEDKPIIPAPGSNMPKPFSQVDDRRP